LKEKLRLSKTHLFISLLLKERGKELLRGGKAPSHIYTPYYEIERCKMGV
jgi:hypothetical protein